MSKVAIVIGATGLVGSALVKQLIAADHISHIITLTRSPANDDDAKVTNHVVDFEDPESYANYVKGELLFSCMGTTLKQAGSVEAQRKVDLDYQFDVAKVAAEQGVKHYLLVSSSGANQASKQAYLKMKGELEHLVKSLPFQRISIFQPSLLVGPRPRFRWGEKAASLFLPLICLLPWFKRYKPISGEQVAAKMCQVSAQSGHAIKYFCLDEIFINDQKLPS